VTLRVVGAGLGRTGTIALEQLLGGPCYHMLEVMQHPEFIAHWQDAADGKPVDWNALMGGYSATVDWPAAAFWPELTAAFPDAIVLLSTRSSAESWWKSANDTIFSALRKSAPIDSTVSAERKMIGTFLERRFTPDWSDAAAAKLAYERHNEAVRANAPGDRLVEWQPGDGWEPICTALALPVPDLAFPHVNSTDEFRATVGLD